MPVENEGVNGVLRRCAAAADTREAWVVTGVVFLVLGFMSQSIDV
jgi:hypothetical protein